jgi:capsular exopolysaccharide synthesis family protein
MADVRPLGPPVLPSEPLLRISWSRYFAALRRYKWLIAGIIILGTAAGFALTRLMAPVYEVHSTLWISTETREQESATPIRAGAKPRETSWPELLTSFAILEGVVRQMSLYLVPSEPSDSAVFSGFAVDERLRPGNYEMEIEASGWQYRLTTDDGTQLQRGTVGDSVGRALGFRWRPDPARLRPRQVVAFTVVTPREAAIELRKSLTVGFSRESNLLSLTLKGDDPQRITRVMSGILDEFISTAAELKRRTVTEVGRTLKEQMDRAEKDLREAEVALESFRVNTITLPSESTPVSRSEDETGNPVINGFFATQVEFNDARRDRQAVESTLAAVQSGSLDPSALWSVSVVQSTAPPTLRDALDELSTKQTELRAAQRRYTDNHPIVRDLKRDVEVLSGTTIPHLVGGVLAELRRRERVLGSQLQTTAGQLRDIPTRTTEETRLRRNVEARELLYTTLKQKYEEATLAEASTMPDVSILDAPVAPEHPSSNRAPFIIFLAFAISALVAVAVAVVLDRVDARFRYPEQATHEMGLEVLGALPALAATSPEHRDPEEASQLVEALRSIRLNLTHAFNGTWPVMFTVSSPAPGDGKSLVSSNLAMSFAEVGSRTLLIDGDLRRGELHSRFGVKRQPGMLDYLEGEVPLEDALRTTAYENLALMPRGTANHRAPELLISPKMSELIEQLKSRFDVMIFDSPPLGVGIDPFVLGTTTGSILLVLRSGETNRKMAEVKLKLLERLPVRLLGTVLNDFRDEMSYTYYTYVESDAPKGDARVS